MRSSWRSQPIASHEAFIGMLVTWVHVPRGGYGYAIPVDATIVKLSVDGTRAVVAVRTKSGARVERNVRTENLRHRDAGHDPRVLAAERGRAT